MGGVFIKFQNVKPPIDNFLPMVLWRHSFSLGLAVLQKTVFNY